MRDDPARVGFFTWLFGHGVMKRTILAPLSALLAIAFGLSWFLSVQGSRAAVLHAADVLALSMAERAATELRSRLSLPAVIVESNAALMATVRWPLTPDRADSLPAAFAAQLDASPSIDLISIGFQDGEYAEAQRVSEDVVRFGRAGSATRGALSIYREGKDGERVEEALRPDYDPRQRPWYKAALGSRGLVWTNPYASVANGEYSIAVVKAVRKQGRVIGVAQASLRLSEFSRYMARMEELEDGFAAIVGKDLAVLASGGRIANPATAAAVLGKDQGGKDGAGEAGGVRRETFNGKNYRVVRLPYAYASELGWTIVVGIAENRFLGPLRWSDARVAAIYFVSFVCALLLAFLIATNIAEPLRLLSTAAAELGSRPFPSEPDAERQRTLHKIALRSDEIGRLAAAFERLDSSLADAFSSLHRSLNEKEVLLREVHHRVKNNLQIVSSLLSLRSGDVDDPLVSYHLEEIRDRVHAMSLVHETIYSSGEYAAVPMDDYLLRVVRSLSALDRVEASITLNVEATGARLPLEKAIPCALVVVELATNAFKHAFAGRENGTVLVSLSEEDGTISLAVVDDGTGMHADSAPGGMGKTIVEALASQLGGGIVTETGSLGTRVTLHFPVRG